MILSSHKLLVITAALQRKGSHNRAAVARAGRESAQRHNKPGMSQGDMIFTRCRTRGDAQVKGDFYVGLLPWIETNIVNSVGFAVRTRSGEHG